MAARVSELSPIDGVSSGNATPGRTRRVLTAFTALRLLWLALVAFTVCLAAISIPPMFRSNFTDGGVDVDYRWSYASQFVLAPYAGGAAERAGVRYGDVLIAIDGDPVPAGRSVADIYARLNGSPGSTVRLTALAADGGVREFIITRDADGMRKAADDLGLPSRLVSIYLASLEMVLMAAYFVAGLFIVRRRSTPWLLMLISLTLVLSAPSFSYTFVILWQEHPGWARVLDLIPALSVACLLPCFYLLPDGRFIPRWTAPPAIAWVVWNLAQYAFPTMPISLTGQPTWAQDAFYLACYATGIYAQIFRYRRASSPLQRQQTKWIVFAIAVAVIGYYGWHLALDVVPAIGVPGRAKLLFWLLARPVYVFSLTLVPIALIIAVTRYRLWDIDFIINRALVYSSLTAVLAASYELFVLVCGRLLDPVTRDSALVVASSTLCVAALARPVHVRIQATIDRKFYRRRYDAARTLDAFAASLRDEVNLDALTIDLLRTVRDTMQPSTVSLWLREVPALATAATIGGRQRPAASDN